MTGRRKKPNRSGEPSSPAPQGRPARRAKRLPAVCRPVADQSLDAAVKWLESEALTDEQRAAIGRGTEDIYAKLEVFRTMLGVQRASRLANNMGWLGEIVDNLMTPEIRARLANDPYLCLDIGKFLRSLQEDDTAFLGTLAKATDPSAIADARKKATEVADAERQAADAGLLDNMRKLAPHNRERLRRLIQALELEAPPGE